MRLSAMLQGALPAYRELKKQGHSELDTTAVAKLYLPSGISAPEGCYGV
jgi:hypothetical protein